MRFVWLAAALVVVPWTLAGNLLWGDEFAWTGLSWWGWRLACWQGGVLLARRFGLGQWSWPPQVVAHGLVPAGLLLTARTPGVAFAALGLAVAFYGEQRPLIGFTAQINPLRRGFCFRLRRCCHCGRRLAVCGCGRMQRLARWRWWCGCGRCRCWRPAVG
ncbi:MAG: hypothetical protein M5U34_20450 [Chloroflexi bacterium]|nr:hypothetical protein [Chloroflexota bacterium]